MTSWHVSIKVRNEDLFTVINNRRENALKQVLANVTFTLRDRIKADTDVLFNALMARLSDGG